MIAPPEIEMGFVSATEGEMVVLYQQLREFLHCELKGVGVFRLVIVCVQDVGQCVSSLLVHYKGWLFIQEHVDCT